MPRVTLRKRGAVSKLGVERRFWLDGKITKSQKGVTMAAKTESLNRGTKRESLVASIAPNGAYDTTL